MNDGRQPKAVLDGFVPISYEQHATDYARAVACRGPWYEEYLIEEYDDGTVTVLPSDATPYVGRQIWRRRAEKADDNDRE